MKKVLIIGAGPAGLTAGYELMKHAGQYDVTILESAGQVGGISKTIQYKGYRMDLGGHCFRTENDTIKNWWKDILPLQGHPAKDDLICARNIDLNEGGPDPETTDDVLLVRNRVAHVLYQEKFFDYPIRLNVNTLRNMGIGSSIKAGFDFVGNSVSRKRDVNLEHYYLNRFGKQLYKMFFEDYIEKLWGKHPKDIDTNIGIQHIKGQSVATVIRENDKNIDDPRFFYPKLGAGQMWETVARKFEEKGGIIHTNCNVEKINKENHKIKSLTCTMGGELIEVETDIVISTMPIPELVENMNDVPGNILDIAAHLTYRSLVTVNLLVPKLNINVDAATKTLGNIIPDTWIYIQDKRRKLARVQIYNNWSPYLLEDPENTVWVGCEFYCDENDEDWSKSEEEWVRFAKQEMSFLHLISSSTPVFESHKECVAKAYPSYFGSYARMDELKKFLDSVRNLYCIGRNGQHKCHDMSYSMMTALAAVKNIIYNVENRANIWDVKQSEVGVIAGQTKAPYQTAAPVPPKANAYIPPVQTKTPSKPIAVPSAPVVNSKEMPKRVIKPVTQEIKLETAEMKEKAAQNPEIHEKRSVSFKQVDKMFASEDAVMMEATKIRTSETKKVTSVSQLRPTLVVQEAEDLVGETAVDIKKKENDIPVKFSVREPKHIVERELEESPVKEEVIKEEVSAEKEVAKEESQDKEEVLQEHPLAKTLILSDDVLQRQVIKRSKECAPIPKMTEIEKSDSISVSPSVVTAENVERSATAKEPVKRSGMEAVRQFERVLSFGEEADTATNDDIKHSESDKVREKEAEMERIEAEKARIEAEKARIAEEKRLAKEAEKALIAEEKRLAKEAEKARIEAEKARIAEEKRLAKEAEKARIEAEKARIAEEKRLAKEAEKARMEAEKARIAEEKRLAEEAEKARIAEEKRLAKEAEKARMEAEKARIAEEKRLAKEAEKARIEAEKARIAEEKRLAEEAEKARIAEEKRLAKEAEKARMEAEKARIAEEKRLAKEAEKARIEAEKARIAEEKRLAEEAEKARIAEEKRLAKEAEKARMEAEKARIAEEKRLAKEAEKARIAEEKRLAKEAEKARTEAEKVHVAEEKRLAKEKEKTDVANIEKVRREKAPVQDVENPSEKTVTVGKITGRIIKTKIVEIKPEESFKRKSRR